MSGMMMVSNSCRNCGETGPGLQSQRCFQCSISWRPNFDLFCVDIEHHVKRTYYNEDKRDGGSIYAHLFFYPDNDKLTDYLFDPCRIDWRKFRSLHLRFPRMESAFHNSYLRGFRTF